MLTPVAQSAMTLPTPGVDERLLEAATGRDDEDDAGDAGQARTQGVAGLDALHAGGETEREVAEDDGDEQGHDGGAEDVGDLTDAVPLSDTASFAIASMSMSATGRVIATMAEPKPTRRRPGSRGASSSSRLP